MRTKSKSKFYHWALNGRIGTYIKYIVPSKLLIITAFGMKIMLVK